MNDDIKKPQLHSEKNQHHDYDIMLSQIPHYVGSVAKPDVVKRPRAIIRSKKADVTAEPRQTEKITVRFTVSELEALRAIAKKDRRSVAFIIREALEKTKMI